MAVLLDCTVSEANLSETAARIKQELVSAGVSPIPREEELETLLRWSVESGSDRISEMPVVQGESPVPPIDGTIEWTDNSFDPGFMVDQKTGGIDHRSPTAQPVVEEGQLLAHVTPPKEGREGRDVLGRPITVPPPSSPDIRPGPNVKAHKKKNKLVFLATTKGRVRWASGVLAVEKVDTIPGNVDVGHGHVTYPESLVIEGDVMAGAEITAGNTIEIQGTVESADIRAGGSLVVGGGIAGAEGRSVRVRGGIHTTYILGAYIEAGGDIVVENEIMQSTLKTQAAVVIPEGRVVGGKVTALGGIVVGEAGSDGQVPTELVAAEDYSLPGKIAAKEDELVPLQEEVERIHEVVDPLMAKEKELSAKQREAATEWLLKATEAEAAVKRAKAEIQEIEADSRARAKPHISVKRVLYAGTTLSIAGTRLRATKAVQGPLKAALSDEKLVLTRERTPQDTKD
jgi:uncharacterized protein (DUF342 family)